MENSLRSRILMQFFVGGENGVSGDTFGTEEGVVKTDAVFQKAVEIIPIALSLMALRRTVRVIKQGRANWSKGEREELFLCVVRVVIS